MLQVLTKNDIFQKDFLESFQQGIVTIPGILITLGISLLLGILVFLVYRKSYQGVIYNRSFNISLIITSLITSLIIMTITSNIVLSLGMVGALSIVRFRTAVKEALDIVFMFWSIAIGITCGAGLFTLAIISSVFIAAALLVFTSGIRSPWRKDPYLLILTYANPKIEAALLETVETEAGRYRIRSKTISDSHTELTLEIKLNPETHNIVDKLMSVPGLSNALLVSYSNEYSS